jgi:hypothetical protein
MERGRPKLSRGCLCPSVNVLCLEKNFKVGLGIKIFRGPGFVSRDSVMQYLLSMFYNSRNI